MKKLRIGIIGAGMMGVQHTEAIRRIPGTEIVALADANFDFAKKACEALDIQNCYADYKEMLEKERLDVVHNCTPNNMHYSINCEILSRGINVYCEKPLAQNSEDTGKLCELAKKAGVKAGVNFNYRQNAQVREMYERAHRVDVKPSENWGQTYLVYGSYTQDWMLYDTDYNWRCVKEIGGESRTVADIGSHWFDTIQYILGKKITRVYAKFMTAIPQRKKFSTAGQTFGTQTGDDYTLVDIDTEDGAYIMLQFEDGVYGNLVLSQVSAGQKNAMVITIDGQSYSMTWKQEEPDKLYIGNRAFGNPVKFAGPEFLQGDAVRYGTLPSGHAVGWHDALRNGIREFYAAVRNNGQANYATFEDGDYVARIVEACIESNKKDQWVEVK